MSKEQKVTVVSYEQFTDIDFIPPANFFVMDSMQNYHFIHTGNRAKAQEYVDGEFGKGRYTVRASKMSKSKGDITAR